MANDVGVAAPSASKDAHAFDPTGNRLEQTTGALFAQGRAQAVEKIVRQNGEMRGEIGA